jgi:predicted transglutaminase-like cysteine proteinase
MLSRVVFISLALTSAALAQPARTPPGAQSLCSDYPWACSSSTKGKVADPKAILNLAKAVNSDVNRRVRSRSDRSQYGVEERWTLPKNAGDCEDYALAKKQALIERGVAPSKLRLAQVMKRNVPSHVVLLVKAGPGREYVLDSLTGRIVDRSSSSYVFLKEQNGAGWETGI